ncbi:small G protein signaling modulator 1-like protein [Sarcoptes scabiei]|uniref:Small G protein signaling modulator 1-like protein n=1 Tax=Sarcoptes scabiei TaxID=52283 RepID=A0A132AE29_SARSC|nr:small G protein signaling modulator 1-like protein [Sarcoptes scabiei]
MDQNKTIGNDDEKEFIEKLLRMVKREVKQIMEEVVTRKFVHEESGSITSFCAAVDACLSHGLKRRALGLFKTNSTTALLQKVAKNCDSACLVLKKVNEIENADPNNNGTDHDDHCSPSSTKTANSASGSVCWSPRDYVESLHQNSKSTLLYGKNNVIMQPNDDEEPMPGYLSLHQDSFGLRVMWTPNNLINVRVEHNAIENSENKSMSNQHSSEKILDNIVYLHCHQQRHDCGSIVMVGRDGVMHPPIKFPKGGHLLSFLSCLETGLMPYGQLDPPLWSQKGRGKILPKLRRKGQSLDKNTAQTNDENQDDGDFAADYVFRIISISDKPETISNELFEPKSEAHKLEDHNCGGSERDPDNKSFNQGWTALSQMLDDESEQINDINSAAKDKQHLKLLCDTMRKQIISRAFYGWLAYCRHLKTVRTHLSGLVNGTIYSIDKPTDASEGITVKVWENIRNPNGQIKIDPMEFYRLVYYGGIDQSIRSDVWLYLLDHFHFDDTVEDRKRKDQKMRQNYELIMSEWLAVEAIVRQRDREIVAANLAKLSSESQNNSTELFQDKSIYQSGNKLNDVFDDSIEKNIETVANDSRFDDDSEDNKRKEKCQHHRSLDYDNDRNDTEERLNPSESDYNSAPPTPDSSMQTSSSKSRHQFGANHHNLEKLRNVMCTYVWNHLDVGYVQGMCDLVAPLLVIFDDELLYVDVFSVWETIWAAKFVSSSAFVLFIALALVEYYRDIILENNMDFTDIIKFFNEMAERHDAKAVLKIARDLVYQIQTMVETK